MQSGTIYGLGDEGDDVTELQVMLGMDPWEQDGSFGEGTEDAVRDFQASQGLPADGTVGPQTYSALLDPSEPPEITSDWIITDEGREAMDAMAEVAGGYHHLPPLGYCYNALFGVHSEAYANQVATQYGNTLYQDLANTIPWDHTGYAVQFAHWLSQPGQEPGTTVADDLGYVLIESDGMTPLGEYLAAHPELEGAIAVTPHGQQGTYSTEWNAAAAYGDPKWGHGVGDISVVTEITPNGSDHVADGGIEHDEATMWWLVFPGEEVDAAPAPPGNAAPVQPEADPEIPQHLEDSWDGGWSKGPTTNEVAAGATMHIGHTGPGVAEVQQELGVNPDGYFGHDTHNEVVAFQQANGLTPPPGMEGYVGPTTWEHLQTQPPMATDDSILTHEFEMMVATIYGEAAGQSPGSWDAIASVIINRVETREWSDLETVEEVIQYSGFDAYSHQTSLYTYAEQYLDDRANGVGVEDPIIEAIIDETLDIYTGAQEPTTDAVLYYSPEAQQQLNQQYPQYYGPEPGWNFDLLVEVYPPGVMDTDDFAFYSYK